MCNVCDNPAVFDELDGVEMCETCYQRAVKAAWYEGTVDELEAAAREHGWECERTALASTGTEYFTLTRYADEDSWECEELVVRVSDHAQSELRSATEYSVSMDGSGHTIEQVSARLARQGA